MRGERLGIAAILSSTLGGIGSAATRLAGGRADPAPLAALRCGLRSWWPHPPPARWTRLILSWRGSARDRRQLAGLDDRMLRDIGIDRAAVEDESAISFWRLR